MRFSGLENGRKSVKEIKKDRCFTPAILCAEVTLQFDYTLIGL